MAVSDCLTSKHSPVMQTILIFLFFAAALGYLGWRGYRAIAAKDAGCGKGCGCAADKAQSYSKT
jgi:hypothetical protein